MADETSKEVSDRFAQLAADNASLAERVKKANELSAELRKVWDIDRVRAFNAESERDALKKALEELIEAGESLKETAETHVCQTYDRHSVTRKKIRAWDQIVEALRSKPGEGKEGAV